MKYYVDKRIMDIVSEKDIDIAKLPSSAYYEYARGSNEDVIIERYQCTNNIKLMFAYRPILDGEDRKRVEVKREGYFRQLKSKPLYLISYTVPAEWYDEMIGLYLTINNSSNVLRAGLPPDWYDEVDANNVPGLTPDGLCPNCGGEMLEVFPNGERMICDTCNYTIVDTKPQMNMEGFEI